ncbi:aspartate kinase [Fragilariopsis cylindrus CCMP1102]|uniref:Aspartate kinase n=1 Tax=Fragilariopsis cylindrus CCMP1102 TaxID=635003 RepID=A0A1E7F3B2_9STRA|nr:aspartate kinase [Fragilariopsis cylindrus CCMP1102]|eukprot:OEU12343.1 aspartate kinase [Fragilariopsis cylindrus CCMP1102]
MDTWTGFDDKSWQVHKFGGTSVANADCYRSAACIVEDQLELYLAVVVSAMGGKPKTTDLLLESVQAAAQRDQEEVDRLLQFILNKHAACLKALFGDDPNINNNNKNNDYEELFDIVRNDLNDIKDILKTVALMKWKAERISELVSGYGELWSARILSRLLHNHGAVCWSTSQSKLKEVYDIEVAKLSTTSADVTDKTRLHFVITGYVASNTEGVATTLQRDGSDYSAAIMGRLLQSTNITIWTDVDGVLSADPRRVPGAHAVSEVSYNEAMELAYFGAKVIHPKTMQPAISSSPQIPIFIRNTFNAKFRGTRIYTSSSTNASADSCVCGFASIDHMGLINVEGSGLIGVQGVAKRLFGTLESLGINVVLISQASSEHSITFATPEEDVQRAKKAIEEEFEKELEKNRISSIDVNYPCSIIAAIGDGMHQVSGVSGRFFSALGDAQINIFAIAQGCSERNISAVIATSQSTRALRALHAAFRLSNTTVRVGIVGMKNQLGESLLRLLEVQRRRLWVSYEIDLQVCAVAMDSSDTNIIQLKNHHGDDSISLSAIREFINPSLTDEQSRISFDEHATGVRDDCAHHVLFDCTNDVEASRFHPKWLLQGVHVVTANNTGISGSKEIRDDIHVAETARGKLSAQYLREVTVCGGLPIISTIRTLLNSGDKIRRVDGVISVAMSYIMFHIAGATMGDECSFSQAVKEAISMGLMEKDLSLDLGNDYASCVLMVLAKELGLDRDVSYKEIQERSEKIVDLPEGPIVDYQIFEGVTDDIIRTRVEEAAKRGCVLRHVGSIDVAMQSVEIKIMEVPITHVFAITPPSCECVRFFTHRYQPYPLVIQGPSAGMDCTSSALLAELLSMMRSKVGTRTGILARSNSSAYLS